MITNLFQAALQTILEADPTQKLTLTNQYKYDWELGRLDLKAVSNIQSIIVPGRPNRPLLVQPRQLPRRRLGSLEGRAAFIHAICHIEFNAINLAWDAIYRFQNMPKDYYSNWLTVAFEEAKHFDLLNNYLIELGYNYGHFPAHNGLWELAVLTDYDVLVRMALVPRIMEARGLDVTPLIIEKFKLIKDYKAVEILNVILDEEVGHVAIGNYWYNYLCIERNLNPVETFKQLIIKHASSQVKPPFDYNNRIKSGFTSADLEMLIALSI
ncbi:MAG: ferritin-like domain-containing protein [Gammaproteobacteria bacterium]|nr:ferritin-like domain-containing protein [Gammaproteobacteria bacterium]